MSTNDLSSLLDECITQLQKGATLEQVLARYPQHAAELRSLLETSASLYAARRNFQLPKDAQARSRMSFINLAYQPVKKRSLFPYLHLRLAAVLTVILVLVVAALLGTSLVSAEALPGDTFYPVKLALEQVQLNLTNGPAQRLQLQENFDERRVNEVSKLKETGRQTNVSFTGVLIQNNGQWQVAGISLDLNDQQEIEASDWANLFVQVTGQLEGLVVHVADIQKLRLTFEGQIERIQSNAWTVAGVEIVLNDSTSIIGSAAVGGNVQITAQREKNGQITALSIQVLESVNPPQETSMAENENLNSTSTPSETVSSSSNGGSDQDETGAKTATVVPPVEQSTPTPKGNEDGESKLTATGITNASPTSSLTPQNGDEHENSTRTQVVGQTSTPTPTLTPTPTNQDTQSTPTPGTDDEHHRSTSTPTPTLTPTHDR
jgi:hypothetical protein